MVWNTSDFNVDDSYYIQNIITVLKFVHFKHENHFRVPLKKIFTNVKIQNIITFKILHFRHKNHLLIPKKKVLKNVKKNPCWLRSRDVHIKR